MYLSAIEQKCSMKNMNDKKDHVEEARAQTVSSQDKFLQPLYFKYSVNLNWSTFLTVNDVVNFLQACQYW